MKTLRVAGPTLLPDGQITETTLTIQGETIVAVTLGLALDADVTVAGTLVPGFIDLQINGAYGYDFTSDGETAARVSARLPETGVTSFVPTIITSPLAAYPELLRGVGVACEEATGSQILGVHLEGPYLSPKRAGAHNPASLRAIDEGEIEDWANPALVCIVTLAPELSGAATAVKILSENGILVSAGHSDATYDQALAGFAAGIGWGTHLFNAMSSLGHREPGLMGALLASDVPCGLIADGIHSHPAMVKLAYRLKGAAGITLVTDAMAAMGMAPGAYRLADREVIVDATSARLANGTLAGSILTMDAAVRNMMAFTGCSLADAVTMASTTPARLLGLARKGRIAAGCDADLVVLDKQLRVAQTWVRGELVYGAVDSRMSE
ncbi:MAG: N-acetylglucosamine-6-phosphate deacetylase [Chloroflexi bacterium]|nr:N-acetylglucosamine-6-phosphate deacetylase [Chloroflexota bacterium]